MQNKRKSERVKKAIKSEVISEEFAAFSSVVDLSKGGIFISTPEPPGKDTEVSMMIHMPGYGEIDIKGIVRWIRTDDNESARAGMGIEFTNVSGDLKKKLDDLVK